MGLDVAETPRANGLKTALDTIVAPQEAFERLRSAPTWGWAFLIAAVLLVAGNLLQRPAQLHAAAGTMQHLFATNSFFANFTGAQKQQALERATHPTTVQTAIGLIGVVVSLLVAALLNSIVLWAGSAIGRGTANFRNLWAASLNITIPTFGLSYVILGVICLALGAEHFQTNADVLRAIPGVAMLFPNTSGVLGGFLFGLNVFTLWGFALNVLVVRIVGGVTNALAWLVPLLILLGGALLTGLASGFYGG